MTIATRDLAITLTTEDGHSAMRRKRSGFGHSQSADNGGGSMRTSVRGYGGKQIEADTTVLDAWRHCRGLIHLHYPIGAVYRELAERIGLPEIRAMAALVGSVIETGANLPQVFVRGAEGLREQMESMEALESALASRRLEGCLLAVSPAVYTAFLRMVAPEYMAPLYAGKGWVVALVVFGLQLCGSAAFFRLLLKEESGSAGMELAAFQEEMAMHMQAGLSLPDAWLRAAAGMGKDRNTSPGVSSQLAYVSRQLAMGTPFVKAIGMLSETGGDSNELQRLAEVLMQNYHLGGDSLVALLQAEARGSRQRLLMDRRAKDAKRETVLLFPMILLLLSALILTAAPALLSVQG